MQPPRDCVAGLVQGAAEENWEATFQAGRQPLYSELSHKRRGPLALGEGQGTTVSGLLARPFKV